MQLNCMSVNLKIQCSLDAVKLWLCIVRFKYAFSCLQSDLVEE
jgi:hypothetical protein